VAIHPPSDIILDVARAGDPSRVHAAADKLSRLAGPDAPEGDAVSDMLGATGQARASSTAPLPQIGQMSPAVVRQSSNPYEGLEAVFLQGFVEYMLPKDSDGFFGDQAADGVMRGMMAEQVAMQMAKSGKIGIAKMIAKQQHVSLDDLKGLHHKPQPIPVVSLAHPLAGANDAHLPEATGPIDLLAGSGST
jgi:hypothetical protein